MPILQEDIHAPARRVIEHGDVLRQAQAERERVDRETRNIFDAMRGGSASLSRDAMQRLLVITQDLTEAEAENMVAVALSDDSELAPHINDEGIDYEGFCAAFNELGGAEDLNESIRLLEVFGFIQQPAA